MPAADPLAASRARGGGSLSARLSEGPRPAARAQSASCVVIVGNAGGERAPGCEEMKPGTRPGMRRPAIGAEAFVRDAPKSRAIARAQSLSPLHAHISFTALTFESPTRALGGSAAPVSQARADASRAAPIGHAPSTAHHGEEALLAVQLINRALIARR